MNNYPPDKEISGGAGISGAQENKREFLKSWEIRSKDQKREICSKLVKV